MSSAIVELRIHDNDKVGTDVDSPAEVPGDDHHLHRSRREQLLNNLLLKIRESLVEVTNAIAQCLHQRLHVGGKEMCECCPVDSSQCVCVGNVEQMCQIEIHS